MKIKLHSLFRSQFIYKTAAILGITVLVATQSMAQLPPAPVIQSPNASSLGTFGNIPVSYFTGAPDITIPIYTLSCGDIKVPIELKYHPASVKPNQHPGWVGLGWNLQSYGCINRVPHGVYDEDNSVVPSFMPYYPINNDVQASGCYKLNTVNWDTKANIKSLIYDDPNKRYDVLADEFYFNFLGYSGKFCYTYEGWSVISDQNIKVELGDANGTEFISKYDIAAQMQANLTKYGATEDYSGYSTNSQPRMFYGFTLITEDGTKYFFGGDGAVEYSSNYYNPHGFYSINSWYLKKIVDVNGNEVNFTYYQKHPVAQLAYFCNIESFGCSRGTRAFYGLYEVFQSSTGGSVVTSSHSGRLIWPLYVNEITTTKDEKVTFETSLSDELNYPDLFYTQQDISTPVPLSSYWRLMDTKDNIKWEKLNSITIGYKNAKILGYNFYYNPSITQRLTLDSIRETDNSTLLGKVYKFDYDDIAGLPEYGGNKTDHWGYFNGTDIENSSPGDYINNKNTTSWMNTKGLIKKISYPTGGYTEFGWESHSCSNSLATDHKSFISYNRDIGGCRIKEIRNFPAAGATPITKNYYYVSNYSNSTYNPGSPSSGILNGVPSYNFGATDRCDLADDDCTISFTYFSTNGYASYSGSHIGYSEVVEKNGDGSYTKYQFTNYGTDSNGKLHYDISSSYVGWKEGDDVYIPFSSLEQERGKITGIYKFKSNDVPVEKTFFRYRDDADRFNHYIKRLDLRNIINCGWANSLVFAAAFKDFSYNYYMVQKEIDQFDAEGKATLKDITDYSYNPYNQVASETKTTSDNSALATTYKYPLDYDDFEILPEIDKLKQKHIINPSIEKIIFKSNNIVNAEYTEYNSFFTSFIKPAKIYQLNSGTPLNNSDFYFKRYEINEENYTFYVEECCHNTESASFNVGLKAHADISLHMEFPHWDCGVYELRINGNLYKNYLALSNNYTIDTEEKVDFAPGNNTITFLYTTNPGHESCAMLGHAEIHNQINNGNIQFNSVSTRPIASINYNTAGQVNEVQKTDDLKTSYFWGYKNTYPIVKADNVSNSDLATAVNSASSNDVEGFLTTVGDMTNETQKTAWKDFNSALHSSLPANTMVSTYTYKPLVGITSSTDPNGVTMYYEYDTFGRLKLIKDDDGRILKTYEYNYQH